ncbi:PAS domain S-box protein [Pseudorhodoferax sp. LjRoot39]|uniref:ATP-binding protein n=1 Tax=Pseudorhodoferax sp. LjRoot39 TaxID=3342328 RepID=UPI003ED157BB
MQPSAPPPALALPADIDERSVFRSLFSAYPDALLVVEYAGRIAMANPAAASLLGFSCDELVGMNVDALVPDSIRPHHAAYRQGYAQAPRARPMGTQMALVAKHKDGSEVMVEIALSPLQDHGLPLVVAAIRGIGAYPRVQQALQRARYSEYLARFGRQAVDAREARVLLDIAPAIAAEALQVPLSMVVLLDADRQAFRVAGGVGLVPGEEIGARIGAQPDTSPGYLLRQGAPITVEDYRTETRFHVPPTYLAAGLTSALAVPLYDRGRVIGTLAVRSREAKRFGDEEQRFLGALSSLLSTCLQRAQSEEALNHAQRLESVGQLTGGIAHDFNNLLTVIQGNLQVLEELPALQRDPVAPQMLAAATRASRRAAELTGKLLAFSRRQVLQPIAVDPAALLQSLVDMLRRTVDQRIRIALTTPAECPMVLADAGQLESALLNIAINARDAMPQGGTLTFGAEACRTLPSSVRLGLEDPSAEAEHFVVFTVCDTGTGMPEQVLERAFEPFFTTKETGRGTGLGLSTVYGFAKQSRGAVAIDSAPHAGTTVTLYLPRPWQGDVRAANDAAEGATLPPGLRVLVVEDDPEVRQVVQNALQAMACTTTLAASGEQALQALQAGAGFDLLLSDIALGSGMRGTELAWQAQQLRADLPVLLMSGFSTELIEADREIAAAWKVLPKPFSRQELARAVARALATRSAGSG